MYSEFGWVRAFRKELYLPRLADTDMDRDLVTKAIVGGIKLITIRSQTGSSVFCSASARRDCR